MHGDFVHVRRARILADHLVPLLPEAARLLDVGCGDGLLDEEILRRRRDVRVVALDVQPRPRARVPTLPFDGRLLPFRDRRFDAVQLVDVLHHADEPLALLAEAVRVSRGVVLLKDHLADGFLARPTLRFMDDVGNARHGVSLPHTYWRQREWEAAFARLGLRPQHFTTRLGLYPWPTSLLFGRKLHFLACLGVPEGRC